MVWYTFPSGMVWYEAGKARNCILPMQKVPSSLLHIKYLNEYVFRGIL